MIMLRMQTSAKTRCTVLSRNREPNKASLVISYDGLDQLLSPEFEANIGGRLGGH
jgi:hypothetical protein